MTTTDYKLYHRLSSGAALTTKDNGDGVYPELFGSEESLEALRAVVEQELADGFVSRYPARGELVVMQQDSEGEQTELERWPVEELLGVAAVAGGGVGRCAAGWAPMGRGLAALSAEAGSRSRKEVPPSWCCGSGCAFTRLSRLSRSRHGSSAR